MAQTTTGAIAGRVVDQQNLALDGAVVRVTFPDLQGLRTTTTSTSGDYLVPLLPSGLYSVSVEFVGLQRHTSAIYPVFVGDGSTIIQYNPIDFETRGADFRVHSLFANDSWRLNNRFTFNLGLRWGKNHGRNAADQVVSTDATWSPRLGVAWDPRGTGTWIVTGSASRYVGARANVVADVSSPAGRSSAYQWEYSGPSINNVAGATPITSDAAIRQVFGWFDANGGRSRPFVSVDVPGVSTQIPGSLKSPNVMEYAAGVSPAFGAKGAIRLDVMRLAFNDFYYSRVDTSTGVVSDALGRRFDLSLIENTDALERTYASLTLAGTYRPMPGLETGGNYTLSRTRGSFEGEDTTGPIATNVLAYASDVRSSAVSRRPTTPIAYRKTACTCC